MTKAAVRALSRVWALPTAAKPALPCLASRVRYGLTITPHRLARIDRAESAVRALLAVADLTVVNLRVRDLGTAVQVEVDDPVTDVPATVTAFRSGGMNSLA